MSYTRRLFLSLMTATAASALVPLAGCDGQALSKATTSKGTLVFDNAAWNYDADNDVYWQVGVVYCEEPATEDYESLGIYVPGAYLTGADNGDGTFTCEVNETGTVGEWTAATAPVVIPVNTAGYAAQAAPTGYSYESVSDYLSEGFVYVYAGCRGRNNGTDDDGSLLYSGGAPWGVTDLKAAIRYLRYNASVLPGNMEAVFTFGHSGGGAQSALVGATGDSELYEPYLSAIGAALEDASGASLSDAVAGSMCWCPITCLDEADAAYEWMMGQYASTGTRAEGTWTAALSADLAEAYASYINGLQLQDAEGTVLQLKEATSKQGICVKGTYGEHVLSVIEGSLNNFLADTTFPYTAGGNLMNDGGFGAGLGGNTDGTDGRMGGGRADGELPDGELPDGEVPEDATFGGKGGGGRDGQGKGELPEGEAPDGELPDGEVAEGFKGSAGKGGTGKGGDLAAEQETYETVQDYLDALNEDERWIEYDESTNTARVTSIGAFARHCKEATKDVGAFDDLNRTQSENAVFGNDESDALHFDATMTRLLQENATTYAAFDDWDESLPSAYATDREQLDSLGTAMDVRVSMYNPLYYLLDAYEGVGGSTPAPHWRIRTGITQGDTSLTTEINLALALQQSADVESVDFETVWGQGHTMAERTGSATENFIAWVTECARPQSA